MKTFINQDTDEPMTNQERKQKYPSGKCPLCNAQDWKAGYDPEENVYYIECGDCQTQFPEDE